METSLHLSQHVELHCMTATVTRSDAEWNVELAARSDAGTPAGPESPAEDHWDAKQYKPHQGGKSEAGRGGDHVSPGNLISKSELRPSDNL